ncbi:penicillin-binding protein activator LpoB [Shewanella sp. YIC-542]|uniref:penicillin-binding protein activator LpoB n=1 Tax=Shewanella mytili TaxID=3377111 RepID=UPI00398F3035
MRKAKTILATSLLLLMSGCATTTSYIDAKDKTTNVVAGLSYADFKSAADEMADEISANRAFVHPQPRMRYILVVSDIVNDTMQRIDTDQLTKALRVKLTNSGTFAVTNAFGANRDSAVGAYHESGELGNSKIVNKASLKSDQSVISPDFSLSGKILQRNNTMDNGDQRIEYYFQLSVTDVSNGISYYEGERVIGKVADGDSVSW